MGDTGGPPGGVVLPLGAAVVRTAPLHNEMTLSFLGRIAARFHLGIQEVLTAVVQVDTRRNLRGDLRADSEVYFNAAGRARLAELCRVPEEHLGRALPAWRQLEPSEHYRQGPAAQLHAGGETVASWGPACPLCTASRTGRREAARLYLGPHQRICARHRYWLLAVPGTGGSAVDLACCPEVIRVQARHRWLLRHFPAADNAFGVAQAVTAQWWAQTWAESTARSPGPRGAAARTAHAAKAMERKRPGEGWREPPEEHLWPARLAASRPAGQDLPLWRILARELVTYPETVAIAELLVSPAVQRRIAADAAGHLPYCLGDLPGLLGELADRLERPWLAKHLAACTSGPLFAWAHRCVRLHGGREDDRQNDSKAQVLWQVAAAHQPRPLADDLATHRHRGSRQSASAANPAGKPPEALLTTNRRRGYSFQAEHAFAAGLAHARAWADEHGHLAPEREDQVGSFLVGQWVHNQRLHALTLPTEKTAALAAIDPWWNIPWSTKWQRSYYRAREHVTRHGPLKAEEGFPDTHVLTGEWLYLQCTGYQQLHPEQRRLLADIGLTAEAARTARPRRTNSKARRAAALSAAVSCARAFAAEHGCLAMATKNTVYNGSGLGQWLALHRFRTRREGPGPQSRALDAIDPWWNPPWPLSWHRTWYRIRAHALAEHAKASPAGPVAGGPADSLAGDGTWAAWLSAQCVDYRQLHPQQQRLLGELGITAETARTRPDEIIARHCARCPGLAHARAYAAAHGHLAADKHTRQDGFPLGRWLADQRHRAREYHRRTGEKWPVDTLLAVIDPWWNPPWPFTWQCTYHRVRQQKHPGQEGDHEHGAGTGHAPDCENGLEGQPEDEPARWLGRQHATYDTLHPEQRRLLARIGITAETARTARRRRASRKPDRAPHPDPRLDSALAHARAWAAEHGHLAVPSRTCLNGFPLGEWLGWQRRRALQGRLSPARHAALTAIDPWWNPPWSLAWHRAYHGLRVAAASAAGGTLPAELPATVRRWIRTQHRCWGQLHPEQQRLLTALGLPSDASTAGQTARATRSYAPSPGLAHARTYAAAHGHLAAGKHTRQGGFPLGRWLAQLRCKARTGAVSTSTLQTLTALDPWWNPPWPFTWHRTWHQYRTAINNDEPIPDTLHRWATTQRTHWHTLHPQQQHLLTTLGLTPPT